jgi:hypothetical protein
LNNELYKIHLKAAQEWGKCWDPNEKSIIESLNKEKECKLEEKLKKMMSTQKGKSR